MTKLYLIPSLLSDESIGVIPEATREALRICSAIYAENIRTTRRFIKKVAPEIVIDNIEWFEIAKEEQNLVQDFALVAQRHGNIGLVSEAGCPAIADPGYVLVAAAHALPTVQVVPLVGPSSIMMALMASGLGGQKFAFHGYLPVDQGKRKHALQQVWRAACDEKSTQLFMETPYRNDALFKDILEVLPAQARLSIAANITAANEFISMKTIGEWRKIAPPKLHKEPCIFAVAQ